MFWTKPKPLTEREQLQEEAVSLACDLFSTGNLYGNDETGWSDNKTIAEAKKVAYIPSKTFPRLWVGGCVFELSSSQSQRIHNVIAKRVFATLKQGDI
jgi:hypothetical protein